MYVCPFLILIATDKYETKNESKNKPFKSYIYMCITKKEINNNNLTNKKPLVFIPFKPNLLR